MNMSALNPSNPGQVGSDIGAQEEANAAPTVGVGLNQPINVPKKPNYLMYAGIALVVIVVGYMVYKYVVKKD